MSQWLWRNEKALLEKFPSFYWEPIWNHELGLSPSQRQENDFDFSELNLTSSPPVWARAGGSRSLLLLNSLVIEPSRKAPANKGGPSVAKHRHLNKSGVLPVGPSLVWQPTPQGGSPMLRTRRPFPCCSGFCRLRVGVEGHTLLCGQPRNLRVSRCWGHLRSTGLVWKTLQTAEGGSEPASCVFSESDCPLICLKCWLGGVSLFSKSMEKGLYSLVSFVC